MPNDPAKARNPHLSLQPRVMGFGVRGVEVAGGREQVQSERKPVKTIILNVEFTVQVPDDTEPNDVTFDIPLESVRVDEMGHEGIGTVTGYCTQEYIS